MQFECTKCGRKDTLNNLKTFRNNLVCKKCYDEFETRVRVREGKATIADIRKVRYGTGAAKRVEYFCSACRYKFTRPEEFWVRECPYCSTKGTVQKSDDFMQNVMKEAEIEARSETAKETAKQIEKMF